MTLFMPHGCSESEEAFNFPLLDDGGQCNNDSSKKGSLRVLVAANVTVLQCGATCSAYNFQLTGRTCIGEDVVFSILLLLAATALFWSLLVGVPVSLLLKSETLGLSRGPAGRGLTGVMGPTGNCGPYYKY
uniref:Uncharacterized protein n=1 Tax=Anopheles merus TaxID=30066 RepID=A0A182US92_ANOME